MANKLVFEIEKSWDDQKLDHDPIKIVLEKDKNEPEYLIVQIEAPFFKSPNKPENAIGEFFNLWDYEGLQL